MRRKRERAATRDHTWQWVGALFLTLVCLPAMATADDLNVVRSIRATGSDVEIEVESTKEFPVRAQVTVLRIGDKEFMRNRPPADGSLNKLIFMIPADEFAQLANGEPVIVQYGRGQSDARWSFGPLNKSQVSR